MNIPIPKRGTKREIKYHLGKFNFVKIRFAGMTKRHTEKEVIPIMITEIGIRQPLFSPTGVGRLVAYEQGNTPPVFPRKVLYFGSRPTEWVFSLFRRETRSTERRPRRPIPRALLHSSVIQGISNFEELSLVYNCQN